LLRSSLVFVFIGLADSPHLLASPVCIFSAWCVRSGGVGVVKYGCYCCAQYDAGALGACTFTHVMLRPAVPVLC
jgi:hypothetical protein